MQKSQRQTHLRASGGVGATCLFYEGEASTPIEKNADLRYHDSAEEALLVSHCDEQCHPANVQWDNPNIPIAIGVSLGSGLATGIGGALVFFPELLKRIPQATILAISLALSAGVMIYVSFIEIFAKSLDAISSSPGISEGGATAITTVCFFIGMLFCVLLELLVHRMSKDDPVAHDVMCAAHGVPGAGLRTVFQANGAEQCCDDDDCEAHSSAANDAHSHEHSHAHEPGLAAAAAPPQVQIEIVNDSQAGDTPVSGKGGGNGKGKKSNASSESSTHSSSSTTLAVAKPSGDYSGDLIGNSAEQSGLKRMGLMTAAAIAIHNFPEGLATSSRRFRIQASAHPSAWRLRCTISPRACAWRCPSTTRRAPSGRASSGPSSRA